MDGRALRSRPFFLNQCKHCGRVTGKLVQISLRPQDTVALLRHTFFRCGRLVTWEMGRHLAILRGPAGLASAWWSETPKPGWPLSSSGLPGAPRPGPRLRPVRRIFKSLRAIRGVLCTVEGCRPRLPRPQTSKSGIRQPPLITNHSDEMPAYRYRSGVPMRRITSGLPTITEFSEFSIIPPYTSCY